MANFLPLKHHMFYCLDRFIERYGMHDPFLEVGCGRGDVSAYLAAKGWSGTAIDFSDVAVTQAAGRLADFSRVTVAKQSLADVTGTYASILLWDVLEHIEDDREALRLIEQRLAPGGYLLLAVPSNPREWRWDDDFYGHVRRYTTDELGAKLAAAGMPALAFWDFTFPIFWAMRRVYTRIRAPRRGGEDRASATRASASVNAWDLPVVSKVLEASAALWYPLHRAQFHLFRHAVGRGHEFFALAQKPLT
ncbi:MAG: class I SAM-dependent methyltransferase [Betaproteobacteria bacterium]